MYYSALFKNMFYISILGFCLMSQGLITIEIIWIIFILYEIWLKNVMKISKNVKMHCYKLISKSNFTFILLYRLSQSNPIKVSKVKKAKNVLYVCFE